MLCVPGRLIRLRQYFGRSVVSPSLDNRTAAPGGGLVWALLWGCVVAVLQCYVFLTLPDGSYFRNHEDVAYMLRVMEYKDCLEAGYWLPQWCTHFRKGFGSPYFNYYHPGFFFISSLLPDGFGLVQRLGIVLCAFSLLGYTLILLFTRRSFGTLSGVLAGTMFVTSQYATTNIYVRGDLSEYSAMMIIPAMLYFLDDLLEEGGYRQFVGLALSGAFLILLHACIALVTFGFLAAVIIVALFFSSLRFRAFLCILALGFAVGLAAFHWIPVLTERHLVCYERAFTGYFEFQKHFVNPDALIIPRRPKPISPDLGVFPLAACMLGIFNIIFGWNSMNRSQARVVLISAGLCFFAVFLMSDMSSFLWHHLPLLHQIQFPWRLLALLSVSIAAIAGCLIRLRSEKLRLAVVGWLIVNLCAVATFDERRIITLIEYKDPRNATEIADIDFGPDIAGEWLPRGISTTPSSQRVPRVLSERGAIVNNYRQHQGVLECDVQTEGASLVELPHLFFPIGWRAAIGIREIAISASPEGLMCVSLPPHISGHLKVTFFQTPMRTFGTRISGLSTVALIGIVILAIRFRRSRFSPKGCTVVEADNLA